MSKKTVVITGSSQGIGKEIALALTKQHYNIVLNYRNNENQAVETLALCQRESPDVMLVRADVSKKRDVETLMRKAYQTFHSADVLINNAARVIDRPIQEMSEKDWDEVIDTNLKGTFLCSQIAAGYMLEQEAGGVIINMGASTGIRGRKNGINTCASKAGIMLMTQCLALELGPKIRVNTIIPGLTLTEETRERFHLDSPDVLQAKIATIPLERIGTPQDVVNAVLILLSEQAEFITGQKIVVDGGQYMW
jgi:3-oxoacyl-[acyl-carrier protein] reductase